MGPIDYTANVVNPMAAAVQGFQFGSAIQQAQAQRQARELAIQQAKAQAERQRVVQSEIGALMANKAPTAQDYIRVASLLPEKEAESMRKNWETLSADRQKGELGFASQVLSAANVGKPEIAIGLIRDRAAAEKNAGSADKAKAYETWASILEADPAQGAKTISLLVAQLPGGDKVLTGLKTMGEEERAAAGEKRESAMFPAKLTEQQAKAQSAAVAAKFAESKAVADLKLTETQTKAIGEDLAIKRQNAAIAAASVAASREGNAIKRQEALLKLEELKDKRDQTVRDKVGEVEAARFNIDNMLNTADRVLKTPKSVIGSAAGPISARIPTMSQDTADFEALVETLGSQAFLSQLPNIKGMGQLSNAEGEKLQAALQNLSLKQSPERLVENVKEAQRLLLKVRGGLTKRYGVPDSVPDTPEAATARPMAPGGKSRSVDDLVKQYGG